MLLRTLTLFVALLVLPSLVPVARAQAPLPLIEKGKLTWGTNGAFPPFESMQDGKTVGYDVDLLEAVVAKMGLQSAPTIIDFKGLIPALLGGRIDSIMSGMYINPERSQVVDFIPYLRIGDQMLVAKGNPQHLKAMAEMCGHRIAAAVGTVYEKQAQALAADCQKDGKGTLTIISLQSTAVSALALREGRADALVASVPTVLALVKESPDAFEITGDVFDNDTLLGWGFPKDKTALKDAVNTALKAVVADGTYAKLIKKYGLPDSSSVF
jgi:polar amino acid transport system substrate-binding protein